MPTRMLIFGNSGAGKSTLARSLAARDGLAHLDLDPLAWMPGTPPERRPLAEVERDIVAFTQAHKAWVIEGCYADLLGLLTPHATELVYLDLPVEQCVEHARLRPWEPHKYDSPEAQDANLAMLLDWIRAYPVRDDACSAKAHVALFDVFAGAKRRLQERPALDESSPPA